MIEDIQRGGVAERRQRLALPQRQMSPFSSVYVPRRTVITEVVTTTDPVSAVSVQTTKTQETDYFIVSSHDEPSAPIQDNQGARVEDDTQLPNNLSLAKIPLWRHPALALVVKWLLVAAIIGATGYLATDTYMTNAELKRRIAALSSVASSGAATPEQRQQAEGTDETQPPANALANYHVASDMPRSITIDKIGVKARVFQMGVNMDGSMQAPIGIYDAGWYTGSARPGTRGAAVIDAHASGITKQGLFGYLDNLVVGDTVELELGDLTKLTYRVVNKESVAKDTVDMKKLLSAQGQGDEGLNLITCSGTWVQKQVTYSNRTIVYTERVK